MPGHPLVPATIRTSRGPSAAGRGSLGRMRITNTTSWCSCLRRERSWAAAWRLLVTPTCATRAGAGIGCASRSTSTSTLDGTSWPVMGLCAGPCP
eukprot:7939670-Pyramimonas_sp.AAC.1